LNLPAQDWQNEVNWDVILDSIQNEKCVLCIGPGVYTEDDVSLEELLADHLRQQSDRLKIKVYDDGWFHYLPGSNVIEPHNRIKAFYNQPFPRAERIFSQLAAVNFHLILSALPDYTLRDAFARYPSRFDAYRKKKPYDPATLKPSASLPLVYNMMGELDKRDSLVLTYDDFYTYLESIFEGKSMSPVVKEAIAEADNFLFIGLHFDRWYMHLFLRILEQHKTRHLLKYAPGSRMEVITRDRCQEQYNITYVEVKMEDFAAELVNRAKAAGLVKDTADEGGNEVVQRLRGLAGKAMLDEAFTELIGALRDGGDSGRDLLNEVVTLMGSYENLKRQYNLKLVDDKYYSMECARITYALLAQIDLLGKNQAA